MNKHIFGKTLMFLLVLILTMSTVFAYHGGNYHRDYTAYGKLAYGHDYDYRYHSKSHTSIRYHKDPCNTSFGIDYHRKGNHYGFDYSKSRCYGHGIRYHSAYYSPGRYYYGGHYPYSGAHYYYKPNYYYYS